MIDRIVRHLKARSVPFRLISYPAPEPLPEVAHPLPPGAVLIDTHLLLVGGRPVIACVRRGDAINLQGTAHDLHEEVTEAAPGDLAPPYTNVTAPIPPFGSEMGGFTLVDEAVTTASVLVFAAFAKSDYIEMSYEEFSRIEQPRVGLFGMAGELPPHREDGGVRQARGAA